MCMMASLKTNQISLLFFDAMFIQDEDLPDEDHDKAEVIGDDVMFIQDEDLPDEDHDKAEVIGDDVEDNGVIPNYMIN